MKLIRKKVRNDSSIKKTPTMMELSLSLSLSLSDSNFHVQMFDLVTIILNVHIFSLLKVCGHIFLLLHDVMIGYLSFVVLCPLQELLNIYQKEKRWFRPSFTKYCVISKAGIIRYTCILNRCQQVYTGVAGYIKVNTGVTRYPVV